MKRRSLALALVLSSLGALGVAAIDGVALADDAVMAPHAGAMGPHQWIAAALDTIELRADQRDAVLRLEADLETQAAPVRAAHDALTEAIAASVEAGAVDHDRIDPLVRSAQAAILANRPLLEQAANRLHDLLDANQRQALVASLRDTMRAGHGFFHHGDHADRGFDHLGRLATELGLSDDQLTTIRGKFEALHDAEADSHPAGGMREHFEHMRALADAFQSDTFDAHALGVGDRLGGMIQSRVGHHLSRIEAALPILTPAQRTELARRIRSGHLEHALQG